MGWKQKMYLGPTRQPLLFPRPARTHYFGTSCVLRPGCSFPNSNQKRNNSMEGGALSGGEGKEAAAMPMVVLPEVLRPKPNFADRVFKFCMVTHHSPSSSLPINARVWCRVVRRRRFDPLPLRILVSPGGSIRVRRCSLDGRRWEQFRRRSFWQVERDGEGGSIDHRSGRSRLLPFPFGPSLLTALPWAQNRSSLFMLPS